MFKMKSAQREVQRSDGEAEARKHALLFIEASAKTSTGVAQAFEELVQKVRVHVIYTVKHDTCLIRKYILFSSNNFDGFYFMTRIVLKYFVFSDY